MATGAHRLTLPDTVEFGSTQGVGGRLASECRSIMREATDNPARGILVFVSGMFLWVVHDAMCKWLADSLHVFELIFLRSVIALPLIFLILRLEQGTLRLRTSRFWPLMLRAAFSLGSFSLFLVGLKLMPLGDAFAISMSSPLIVAALSGPLLGEPATRRQWIAVIVGFGAVMFMIRPGGAIAIDGALVMLGSTICYSLGLLLTRSLGRTESASVITVFVMVTFVVAGGATMPFVWTTPSVADFGWLTVIAVISAAAMYLTIQGFRIAPPALLGPFQYSALIWAVLIGFIWWGDVPDISVVIAAMVVVASGLIVLKR